MPIQAPQWTEYLSCPVCENAFESKGRLPISLGCGHSICRTCLANLQRKVCPFDQGSIRLSLSQLPVNTPLLILLDPGVNVETFRPTDSILGKKDDNHEVVLESDDLANYNLAVVSMEDLAMFLRPSSRQQLSRPMHRKLVTLITCQLFEEEGRSRATRAARSLGERSVTELILQHQHPQQLSANLWAAVRARGCQFLGPAMQEEVLNLVLLALEDGSALSRKVLVMFVVQRLEPQFPQASKTSIGHVVQLLYRASCFKVTKRDGDSSLMQLKEEFRTYETLRREHDAQIVQIATEAGLRIAPDQWSSLLYGDTTHKSHMQSIIDKLQTPQSFIQSVQELVIALQRTGDPGRLGNLRPHLDFLSTLDSSPDSTCPNWEVLTNSLNSVLQVVSGLIAFIEHHTTRGRSHVGMNSSNSHLNPDHQHQQQQQQLLHGVGSGGGGVGNQADGTNVRYKTSLCRDLSLHGSCPRGRNCTFAHSQAEMEQHRQVSRRQPPTPHHSFPNKPHLLKKASPNVCGPIDQLTSPVLKYQPPTLTPVAQVAPLQRSGFSSSPIVQPQQQAAQQPHNQGATTIQHHIHHSHQQQQQQQQQLNPQLQMTQVFGQDQGLYEMEQPQQQHQAMTVVNYGGVPTAVAVIQPQAAAFQGAVAAPQHHIHSVAPSDAAVVAAAAAAAAAASAAVQNPSSAAVAGIVTPAEQHESNAEMFPIREESNPAQNLQRQPPPVGMETKSLSALKSRKEEIMDHLEDLVGKEEAEKISHKATEPAISGVPPTAALVQQQNESSLSGYHNNHPFQQQQQQQPEFKQQLQSQQQSQQPLSQPTQQQLQESNVNSFLPSSSNNNSLGSGSQGYSIWTSKSIATLSSAGRTRDSSLTLSEGKGNEDSSLISSSSSSVSRNNTGGGDDTGSQSRPSSVAPLPLVTCPDDIIPFADTPHISRFGPISRKAGTPFHSAQPSQTQAVISDEPTMTAVVRHSKQLTRQVPTMAALYHQNGSRTTLQPVAVGVNGEIGYIAVPEVQPDFTLQQIQQTSALHQHSPSPTHHHQQNHPAVSQQSQALYQESERMKIELEQLQKKISDLKWAHRDSSTVGVEATAAAAAAAATTATSSREGNEKDELAMELHMIESTIRDREREILVNHMRVAAAENSTGLDYGPYDSALGTVHYDESNTTGITTTATSGFGPKSRGSSTTRTS